jgi:hypothetical protein
MAFLVMTVRRFLTAARYSNDNTIFKHANMEAFED